MILLLVFISIIAIFGLLSCLVESKHSDPMCAFCIIVLSIVSIILIVDKEKRNSKYTGYQVRELEKNTVFNITDSVGQYTKGDSVWVNYSKMMIDPLDSVAMKCVIIKELE